MSNVEEEPNADASRFFDLLKILMNHYGMDSQRVAKQLSVMPSLPTDIIRR